MKFSTKQQYIFFSFLFSFLFLSVFFLINSYTKWWPQVSWLSLTASVSQTQSTATNATLSDIWSGAAHLGSAELITFTGNPANAPFADPGRFSVVEGANGTMYGYFRQEQRQIGIGVFEIYMAISEDRGKTFTVQPDPIIRRVYTSPTDYEMANAYDPDVIKRSDGYYLLFESAPRGCANSSSIAFSADGIHNWEFKGVPICTTDWAVNAVTPNFVETPSGDLYIQWVFLDSSVSQTTHHQTKFDTSNLFKTITNDARAGQLPQSPAGSWDDNNFGSGSVIYENGYYYLFFEGANYYGCQPPENSGLTSLWGIGLARTNNIADPSSWSKNPGNPLLLSQNNTNCWMAYPKIISIDDKYFLYYSDWATNWTETGIYSIFRREIVFPPDTTPPATPSGLLIQ